MKVWITKYALSVGIKECEIDHYDADPNYVFVKWPGAVGGCAIFCGDDWHATHLAARSRAAAMRVAKIASLRKQIAKLEKLSFARAK